MPLVFAILLFGLVLVGIVLDGFDLGVGILLLLIPEQARLHGMAFLSPWRAAHEFWLLPSVGLFAAAFPFAWGIVLGHLHIPFTLMLMGMVLRSVCFDFRLRARTEVQLRWILGFWLGSLMTAFGQGMALGRVATGYQETAGYFWFSLFVGACAVAAYGLLGATWMTMRARGSLQRHAVHWARHAIRWTAAGMVAIAVTLGVTNSGIFYKWSNVSHIGWAVTMWSLMLLGFVATEMMLARLSHRHMGRRFHWVPFTLCVGLFLLMLAGLVYSLFPYLIFDEMTLWDGAASRESLRLVLAGMIVIVPCSVFFNVLAHRCVFSKEQQHAGLARKK